MIGARKASFWVVARRGLGMNRKEMCVMSFQETENTTRDVIGFFLFPCLSVPFSGGSKNGLGYVGYHWYFLWLFARVHMFVARRRFGIDNRKEICVT